MTNITITQLKQLAAVLRNKYKCHCTVGIKAKVYTHTAESVIMYSIYVAALGLTKNYKTWDQLLVAYDNLIARRGIYA